jgi:hypothetical protein
MDRRRRTTPGTPPSSAGGELSPEARLVADRLQQLSVPEAERVLERAIELETAAPGTGPGTAISTEMLARIAAELDIDVAHLRQALVEEMFRVQVEEPDLVDRLIAPRKVSVHGPVAGTEAEIRAVIDAWMGGREGMRKRAEDRSRTAWERDRSFAATIAHALSSSRGPGTLRKAAAVTTSVRPATDTEQVVVVEADTTNLRRLAIGLLAGAAATGAIVAGAATAFDPSGFGVGEAVAGLGTFAVLGGGVLIGVKMWARQMKDAVDRVLDAVRSPHLVAQPVTLPFGLDRIFRIGR